MFRHLSSSLTFVTLLSVALFAPSVMAQNTYWTSQGPDGGSINCMAISPSDPMIMYAGTSAGVYKTLNGGENWQRSNFTSTTKVTSILVHPLDPDRVLLGSFRRGLYESDNGGGSWNYRGLTDHTISCMAQNPYDPGSIYFGTGESMSITGEYVALIKLDNDWADNEFLKWWEIKTSGWLGWKMVNCILPDPDSAHILYAGGIRTGYDSNFGALLVSRDSGKNWSDVKVDVPHGSEVSRLVMLKNSSGKRTLVAICGGSLLTLGTVLAKSSDEGNTWEEIDIPYQGSINPNILIPYPGEEGTVVIGSNDEDRPLWLYREETGEWDFIIGTGLPYYLSYTDLQASPGETPTWFLPTRIGGLYTSKGKEGRWSQSNRGFDNANVHDFTVAADNPSQLFAVTNESSKILSSADAGQNWSPVPGTLNAGFNVLASAPGHPHILWAAQSSAGSGSYWLYKSENAGQNWTGPIDFLNSTPHSNRTEITDILISPDDPDIVMVACQPRILNGALSGFGLVARTTNGGTSWSNYPISASCLAMDPDNHGKIYAGKERSGQVFLIHFDGNATSMSNTEPEGGIADVQDIAFDHQGNYYVATENGLWRVGEQGWDSLPCPESNITSLVLDHISEPSVIYASGDSQGVLVSKDMGQSWIPFNNGLRNTEIRHLELSSTMLYASAEYGGIWSREIPENLDPPFLTHHTGNLEISVFQNGALGHAAPNWNYGDGLDYFGNVDPLYHGGLLIGTEESGLVTGHLGTFGINSDFRNTSPITGFSQIGEQWDQVAQCRFDDASSASPLGVEVVQRSYSSPGKDFVILRYALESKITPLKGVHAGIFADWDVGGDEGYNENMGGYDLEHDMAYQFLESGQPDPNYYGIVALDGLSGARIIDRGESRYIRRAAFLWITLVDETPPEETGDLRTYIGTGPFDLEKEVAREVSFAIVAGSNLAELQDNAELAMQEYESLKILVGGADPPPFSSGLENYPNPFHDQTLINYDIQSGGEVWLRVYDMRGMEVRSVHMGMQEPGQHSYNFGRKELEAGIYSYQIMSGDEIRTSLMLIY